MNQVEVESTPLLPLIPPPCLRSRRVPNFDASAVPTDPSRPSSRSESTGPS